MSDKAETSLRPCYFHLSSRTSDNRRKKNMLNCDIKIHNANLNKATAEHVFRNTAQPQYQHVKFQRPSSQELA